ncbi:Tropomodulin [Ostertagia ostertagi]
MWCRSHLEQNENTMLPPSQRCRDQTTKAPTGPFKRDHLLKYLEEKAKSEKDWEDMAGECWLEFLGKVWEATAAANLLKMAPRQRNIQRQELLEWRCRLNSIWTMTMILMEALDGAPGDVSLDLAGILGMHNILNQPQYYNALKGKQQDDSTGTTFAGIIRAYEPKETPDEPENDTNVDECIKRLEEDDEDMKEVNVNNMKRISKGLIKLLETSTSLKVLNVESNFISPELLAKLLRATLVTQCLTEFKAENQRQSVLGNQVEMDMTSSVEENESLLRVGIAFQSMEARHRVSDALEKNYERVRLRRLGKLES